MSSPGVLYTALHSDAICVLQRQPCSTSGLGGTVTPSLAGLVLPYLSCVFSSEEMSFFSVLSSLAIEGAKSGKTFK